MTGHADKYYLLSNDTGESLMLDNAPVGWDATRFNILRDAIYLGVIKTISVEFNFVGEGFDFLQRHRLLYGMDASILFRVYRKNVYLVGGKVNFENFYEDRKFNKFRVDIVQGTFHQKFTNNEDVRLNILNDISLDRLGITPAELRLATFRGKEIQYVSTGLRENSDVVYNYHHTIPFFFDVNGNPGVQQPSSIQADFNPDEGAGTLIPNLAPILPKDIRNDPAGHLYKNTLNSPQTLTIDYDIVGNANYVGSVPGFDDWEFDQIWPERRIRLVHVDSVGTVKATLFESVVQGFKEFGNSPYGCYGPFAYSSIIIVTLQPGERLFFLNEQTILNIVDGNILVPSGTLSADSPMDNIFKVDYTYSVLRISITQPSTILDDQHSVILPHEIFQTLISQINGGRFISNYFGRLDLGYYEDGEGAYIAITTGEILRGIDPTTVQVNTSFRDAFKSYNAIRCLGAIIGEDYIRIEPLDDLFNYEIAADIGEVREFAITPAKDFIFNSIKAGFPNNEYEQENGRDEFNTTYQYTNGFQSVKRELDLVSVYNGDGYGIEFARRANIMFTGTADSRYDAKIFLICLKLDDEGELVTKRDEDVLSVSGIFSPTTAYNLDIAVGQNMLRWKRYLNIPLYRKAERKLFFQGKDKKSSMQLVTDLGISNDGQDISLGGSYYFLPEERRFQCPIHIDILFQILANPLGLVKYTYKDETFYDLIYELDSEVEKAATQWRVLGTKASPIEETDEPTYPTGPILKYGSRLADYVKYNIDEEGFVLYAGGSADDGSIPIGELLFRGFVPTITIANTVNITPSVGVGLFTGYAPSVFGAGGVGVALWTGLAPTVVIDVPGGEGLATLGGDFLQTLDDEYIIELP